MKVSVIEQSPLLHGLGRLRNERSGRHLHKIECVSLWAVPVLTALRTIEVAAERVIRLAILINLTVQSSAPVLIDQDDSVRPR